MTLREKTITAVKWNLVATILTTFLGLFSLWALSYLLSTQDYGVISATLIITNFFRMLLDFGISNSIIRSNTLSEKELSSLYTINILIGIFLSFIVFIFSSYISDFLNGNETLTYQIKMISFGFFILSFGLQPTALLRRDFNFKSIAKISVITVITNFIISVSLAWIYKSPWCVAIGFLVSSFINVMIAVYEANSKLFYRLNINFSSVHKHIHYGLQLVGDSVINQVNVNTYPILMSRLISLTAIGGYNLAYSISLSLFEKMNPILSHALFPAFSKISNDESKLKESFLKVTTFSSLVNFPMLLGMSIISSSIVHVFFDEKWLFISPIINILCLTGVVRSLDPPVISILLVKAKMYRNIYLGIIKIIVGVPLTWYLGLEFGLIGIVYSFLIIQILNTISAYFFLVKPCLDIKMVTYLKSIVIPLIHVLPMLIVGYLIKSFDLNISNLLLVVITVFSCFITYGVTIILSPVIIIREFKDIVIKNFLGRFFK